MGSLVSCSDLILSCTGGELRTRSWDASNCRQLANFTTKKSDFHHHKFSNHLSWRNYLKLATKIVLATRETWTFFLLSSSYFKTVYKSIKRRGEDNSKSCENTITYIIQALHHLNSIENIFCPTIYNYHLFPLSVKFLNSFLRWGLWPPHTSTMRWGQNYANRLFIKFQWPLWNY